MLRLMWIAHTSVWTLVSLVSSLSDQINTRVSECLFFAWLSVCFTPTCTVHTQTAHSSFPYLRNSLSQWKELCLRAYSHRAKKKIFFDVWKFFSDLLRSFYDLFAWALTPNVWNETPLDTPVVMGTVRGTLSALLWIPPFIMSHRIVDKQGNLH